MPKHKHILIKNVYYMLAYAFQTLRQSHYKDLATEDFQNIHDLFAAILAKGIADQLKHGLYHEYQIRLEPLPVLRGKLNISGTIQNKLQRKQILSCEYDELSVNNLFNQILKTTALILIRQPTVSTEHKSSLKKVMLFFGDIDTLEESAISWSSLHIHRNNQTYELLLNMCYLVLQGLLLSTVKGEHKLANFLDEQRMSHLYEKFVLEYYRRHFPSLQATASWIAWNLDDTVHDFLPIMKSDITLKSNGKTLIIDTKYYKETMQQNALFGKKTLHSHNLYQIFAYVKNYDTNNSGKVSGMLLYAQTKEAITPDCDFSMSGNKISVKTLDLNVDFTEIASKLNKIAALYFGLKPIEAK